MTKIIEWFKESAFMEKVLTLPLFVLIPALFFSAYDNSGWSEVGELLSMLSFGVLLL